VDISAPHLSAVLIYPFTGRGGGRPNKVLSSPFLVLSCPTLVWFMHEGRIYEDRKANVVVSSLEEKTATGGGGVQEALYPERNVPYQFIDIS
jgi:hypothetical protein